MPKVCSAGGRWGAGADEGDDFLLLCCCVTKESLMTELLSYIVVEKKKDDSRNASVSSNPYMYVYSYYHTVETLPCLKISSQAGTHLMKS